MSSEKLLYWYHRLQCLFAGHPTEILEAANILTKERCLRCGLEFVGNREVQHERSLLRWDHDDPELKKFNWRVFKRRQPQGEHE